MKTIVPNYYPAFRCIAGACRHSCCVGWEIDIDPASLSRYRAVEGEFGVRLRENIQECDGVASFGLIGEEERCPFLNAEGLCDLYIALGEDALCQICTDHPRFRNFFSDRTEIGLGLCCEAAGELILNQTAPVTWVVLAEEDGLVPDAEEEEFFALREEIFAVLQDRTQPVRLRLEEMLRRCGANPQQRSQKEWAEIYLGLERLDPAWGDRLEAWQKDPPSEPVDFFVPNEIIWEQLAVYFAFRHLADGFQQGDLPQRAAFVARSCVVLAELAAQIRRERGLLTPADVVELARMYSAEIEYSEENMSTLLENCGGI